MKTLLSAPVVAAFVMAASLSSGVAAAKPWWMRGIDSNENDFLPPDVAFRVSSRVEGGTLRVRWVIADGYYLYRQRMQIAAESPDLVVTAPAFPSGTQKTDPYLGTQEIYTQQVEGTAAYRRSDAAAHPIQIKVTYQGCAQAGLCYPPISKVLFPGAPGPAGVGARSESGPSGPADPAQRAPGGVWEGIAIGGGVVAFFLAGLLLRKGRRLTVPV